MSTLTLGPIQKEWIQSLRDHPERQGRLYLEINGKRCCLGELLVITTLHGITSTKTLGGVLFDTTTISRNYCSGIGNSELLGLKNRLGGLRVPCKGKTSLATMNDNGMTWAEIADYVEANPGDVFTKSY